MGGGVVSGLIWGAVVSVVVLAALSLSIPLPERQALPPPAPSVAPLPEPEISAPEPEAVAEPEPVLAPEPETAPEAVAAPVAPVLPDSAPQTPQAPGRIDPAPRLPQIETPPETTAAPPPMDAVASDPAPLRGVEPPASAPSATVALAPAQPEIAALPVAPSPQFGTPSEANAGGAAPRRLAVSPPEDRLTGIDTAPPPAVMPAPAPETHAQDTPAATGALAQNAVPFAAAPDQPILSVILIEDQSNPLELALLSQISFPVSFAIDPLQPGAQARAALLRDAGFEVVILAAGAIPEGATPADVEVALAAARETMPQAVALIDDPASRIQGDRPVLDATVAALAETGHGLIAFARGLNAAETTARRVGVAAATAFRLLDDEDQRAPVITRYLDRAGFAAGQQGGVIVVGRVRPDTITALFSWALSGRSEDVRLAPVSAVLMRLND